MEKWLKTALFLAGSAILTRFIPFNSLFRNIDTMVHEFGHALATLLLSGSVLRIELYADHSGVTYSSVAAGIRAMAVSLAGYPVASLFALLLFDLYRRRRMEAGLIISTAIALLMLVLYVRGSFGMIWLAGFIVLNVLMLAAPVRLRQFYYLLVAFLSLEESVLAPLTLLAYAVTSPQSAGDAANLAQMTGIPAVIWALLFVLLSLVCARYALRSFFKRSKGRAGV